MLIVDDRRVHNKIKLIARVMPTQLSQTDVAAFTKNLSVRVG